MPTDERHPVRHALRWSLIVVLTVLGVLVGIGGGRDYYTHHVGDWRIGVTAIAIGAGIALGTALIVLLLDRALRSEEAMARARRTVIQSVVLLLAAGGALGGAGAGYAYEDNTGRWIAAIFVGIGSALGAWLAAALLGLLVEIANSLRQISVAVRPTAALPAAGREVAELGHPAIAERSP